MDQFWGLTPKETAMVFEAVGERAEGERRRDMTLAWFTAALVRAKELPTLKRLLEGPPKPLSEEEAAKRRAEFEELRARMGAKRWPVNRN